MSLHKIMKYDVILVLSITVPDDSYKHRIEKAVELYKKKVAPKIVFTGRTWGGLKKLPKVSEAREMLKYCLKLGVSRKDILLEEKSFSTLGNIYFAKKLILEPNKFKRLIIITHREHFEKSKYCAKLVLGSKYKRKFIDDGTGNEFLTDHSLIKKGHYPVSEMKRIFRHIKPGDDRAVAQSMSKHHYYKRYNFKKLKKVL